MTDLDWARAGWQHADIATSWALGTLAYLALVALGGYVIFRALRAIEARVAHHLRVRNIRRDARRAGRAIREAGPA